MRFQPFIFLLGNSTVQPIDATLLSQTPDIEVALSGPIDPPTMHH
jgi:hypothetical protein